MITSYAWCGNDIFANVLERLIAEGRMPSVVFTRRGRGVYDGCDRVVELAEECGARLILSPIRPHDLAELAETDCPALIVAGYPHRVPACAIGPTVRLNVHPTLLPEGRGPWPLSRFILDNRQEGGVTLHLLVEAFDAGPILAQASFSIDVQETLDTLLARVQLAAADLLLAFCADSRRYLAAARPQMSGTWWPAPTRQDRTIDWSAPVACIDRRVRAFGKEGCFAFVDNEKLLVRDVRVWLATPNCSPGTTVIRSRFERVIAACDGFVCIRFWSPAP